MQTGSMDEQIRPIHLSPVRNTPYQQEYIQVESGNMEKDTPCKQKGADVAILI